jgi:hypothetical protein
MSGYCKECGNQQCICGIFDTINPIINNAVKVVQDAIIASQPCEHIYGCQETWEETNIIRIPFDDNYHDGIGYEWFTYCPKCGKKL